MYASYPFVLAATALLVPLSGAARSPVLESTAPSRTSLSLEHRSAFNGYRPYREESVADWRAVNEEVARIGGHVGIVGGAGHGTRAPEGAGAITPGGGEPPRKTAPDSGAHGAHH